MRLPIALPRRLRRGETGAGRVLVGLILLASLFLPAPGWAAEVVRAEVGVAGMY